MKKTIMGMLSILLVIALISTSLFSANEELPDDEVDEMPTRGTRGYAQANDIKVDVLGDSGAIYNLAGIGSNASGYHLYNNRSWVHQWLSTDDIAFYDTVWHPSKQYSLVVGANHSWEGEVPSDWMAAAYKYEGASYTDLCDLDVFTDGDWLYGVDFAPNGTLALIVGDWGGVWKFWDANTTITRFQETDSVNYSYYESQAPIFIVF